MQHKRFTIVALAVSAAWSSVSFAQESPAVTQCVALVKQEKITEAEPHCAKAAEEPGKFGKLLYADFHARKGDADDAIRRYSEILQGVDLAKPTRTEYAALRNRALLGFRVGLTTADVDTRAALQLMPDDIELLRTAAYKSGSESGRLEYADRLVALDPKSVQAHVLRSYALTALGEFPKALEAADLAATLDSNSPLPLIARGFAQNMGGNYDKAEREYAAAVRKAPNEPEPRVNQAEMLAALKRYDDAIEVVTAALKLRPDQPHALRLRASARLWMGDAEGALADAEAANQIEPDAEGANLQITAKEILAAQKAIQPRSIDTMEKDRQTVLAAIRADLHGKCGHYTVPKHEDLLYELDTYRTCVEEWYDAEVDSLQDVGQEVLEAASRFEATAALVESAEVLQCSKMPGKSRCIPDSLYARAVAASNLSDPKGVVGEEEFERLNKEVMAYNTTIKRQNMWNNTRFFPARSQKG